MGRWSYGGKTEADGLKKVSVSFLRRHQYFCGWRSGTIEWTSAWGDKSSIGIVVATMQGQSHARFHYTQTDSDGEKKKFDYQIPLVTTPCRYGGKRYWFQCPWYKGGVYCGRRVGVLYKDGDYFACRHCYNLTYNSRNENRNFSYAPLFDAIRIEDKIEKLSQQIKRPYYAGRPTKKQRKLETLYRRATLSYGMFSRLNKRKRV